jgi:uncharacterized repeat protein (TIGR01451 family)
MSPRLPLLVVFLFALVPAAHAQRGYAPLRESAEPPMADDPNAAAILQQAGNREPRTLAPGFRNLDVPAPAVVLRIQAPIMLALNQDVEVRIVVENVSRVAARNVTVIYPLAPDVVATKPATPVAVPQGRDLTWKFDNLAAGAQQVIVLTVKPPPNAADFESKARVVVEQEQSAKTKFSKSELKVSKTGPRQAQRFDILVFGVTVLNPSGLDLTDVTVSDKLPAGLTHRPDDDKDRAYTQGVAKLTSLVTDNGQTRTWKIDRLPAGQSRRFEYYVAASTAPAGTIEHQAYAVATGGAADTAIDKVELIEPKLEIKVEAPTRKSATLTAPTRITLTNRGPRALQNIVVTDQMDKCKLDQVGAGGQTLPNGVQWIVTSLQPNQTQVFDLVISKPEGGPVRQKVTAVYRGLTVPEEAVTEFEAVAKLTWDFRGNPATVEVNGEVVYEITLRNAGAARAENVRPTIRLPEELVVVKAEPENKVEGGNINFEPTTLPPNERATFRVRAKAVKASLGARVTAELSGDPFPTGAVTRQEMTAIGSNSAAPTPPPPMPAPATSQPVPVPPPPKP